MDDQQSIGALSQVNPATPMVQSASSGNPILSQMMENMLANSQQKQNYLRQQQEAYEREMAQYAQQVEASRNPATSANRAGLWGAIAAGASKLPNIAGNLGAQIGNMGANAGAFTAEKQQADLNNQRQLTQLRESNLRNAEAKDQTVSMLRALNTQSTQGKWLPTRDDQGNLIWTNNVTMEQRVIPSSKLPLWKDAYNRGLAMAKDRDESDPTAYAISLANEAVGASPTSETASKIPSVVRTKQGVEAEYAPSKEETTAPKQEINQEVSLKVSPEQQAARDAVARRLRIGEQSGNLPAWPTMPEEIDTSKMSPEDAITAERLSNRIKANPIAAANDVPRLNAITEKYVQKPETTGLSPIAAAKARAARAEAEAKAEVEAKHVAEIERQKILGKESGEKEASFGEDQSKLAGTINSFDDYLQEIESLKKHPGLTKATGWEGFIPLRGRVLTAPGDSGDFLTKLEQVKSGALMETLKSIKALSNVGASGFGSLTEKEADRIIGAIAALDVAKQTPEALKEELGKIETRIKNLKSLSESAFARKYQDKTKSNNEAPKSKIRRTWNPETGDFE